MTLPISVREFSEKLRSLFTRFRLPVERAGTNPRKHYTTNSGIAVSGGSDSMALCALMVHHMQLEGWPRHLFAYTIDHGIRPESSQEAEMVGQWVQQMGSTGKLSGD